MAAFHGLSKHDSGLKAEGPSFYQVFDADAVERASAVSALPMSPLGVQFDLPFTFLSDSEKTLANALGVVKEKNMYGKKVMGIERSTFVIDANGKIARIFPKVKVDGHANEVLAALAAL